MNGRRHEDMSNTERVEDAVRDVEWTVDGLRDSMEVHARRSCIEARRLRMAMRARTIGGGR